MLIAHSMPAVSGVTLSGGAGAAWLTSDGHAALFDGKPARKARLQWRNDATPVITHGVALAVTFGATFVPRVICLLGLSCGAGVKVEVRGTGAVALGGNALTQRTVLLPDGTVGLWIVTDGAASVGGLEVAIFNDRNGATWATASTALDIGELAAMPAVDIEVQPDWSEEVVDPTVTQLTFSAQLASVQRQAYRRLEAALTADSASKVRAGGLAGGMDWNRLRAALLGDRRMAALPRWKDAAGAVDGAEASRTALYGVARLGATRHLGGDFYGASIAVQEVPALA